MSVKRGQNQYLDYLVDPSFQGFNRLSVLSFEDNATSTGHARFLLSAVEEKDYNVTIDRKTFSISQQKMIQENIITFKKLQLV